MTTTPPADPRAAVDRWLDRSLVALLVLVCAVWSGMGLALLSVWWRFG